MYRRPGLNNIVSSSSSSGTAAAAQQQRQLQQPTGQSKLSDEVRLETLRRRSSVRRSTNSSIYVAAALANQRLQRARRKAVL